MKTSRRAILMVLVVVLAPLVLRAGSSPLEKMAKELAKSLRKLDQPKVGVVTFSYPDRRQNKAQIHISEQLSVHLIGQKGINVVERYRIPTVLREQYLATTGILDPESVKELGRVHGLDVIITGTLLNLDKDQTEVNARALMINDGRVVAASRCLVARRLIDDRHILEKKKVRVVERDDPLKQLARHLMKSKRKLKDKKIAVLVFPHSNGYYSTGSDLASERLITYFVQKGQDVIERRHLERILEEKKFQLTGATGSDPFLSIGKILSADLLVAGALHENEFKEIIVSAKMIDVEKGSIFSAGSTIMKRVWVDNPRDPNYDAANYIQEPTPFLDEDYVDEPLRLSSNKMGDPGIRLNNDTIELAKERDPTWRGKAATDAPSSGRYGYGRNGRVRSYSSGSSSSYRSFRSYTVPVITPVYTPVRVPIYYPSYR